MTLIFSKNILKTANVSDLFVCFTDVFFFVVKLYTKHAMYDKAG